MLERWLRPAGAATPNGLPSGLSLRRTPNFWPRAVRAIVREISEVTPDIQDAFLQVWVQTKMLGVRVDDNRMLCRALRILMPGYKGDAVPLFRGAGAGERRRAAYGISWTSNLSAAEEFAEGYRVWPGGSVVLETVAPPEAIISTVEYPPPMTEAEKAELPPNAKIVEYHEEREYLVERRLLGSVKLLRRYPQLARPPSRAAPRLCVIPTRPLPNTGRGLDEPAAKQRVSRVFKSEAARR